MTTLTKQFEINISNTRKFELEVAKYLEQHQHIKKEQEKLDQIKGQMKEYMEDNNITSKRVADYEITLSEITRTSVDAKIAKVVIPKKYLDQAIKSTTYQQLKVLFKPLQTKKK